MASIIRSYDPRESLRLVPFQDLSTRLGTDSHFIGIEASVKNFFTSETISDGVNTAVPELA